MNEALAGASGPSRARRLFAGWSANLFQMILGVVQQVALIPVFLHFWSSEVLAAWLVIYAVGNLVPIADAVCNFVRSTGFWRSNRASIATAGPRAFTAMLRIYLGVAGMSRHPGAGRHAVCFAFGRVGISGHFGF